MSWKRLRRQLERKKEKESMPAILVQAAQPTMIEHSICKYTAPPPVQHNTHVQHIHTRHGGNGMEWWSKARCDAYIENLKSKGWVKGAPIETRYFYKGVIDHFKTIGDQGLSVYSESLPAVIAISRDGVVHNSLYYHINELSLIPITTTSEV